MNFIYHNAVKETEKCILNLKNHLEIIQLYVFLIQMLISFLLSQVKPNIGPCNYHDINNIIVLDSVPAIIITAKEREIQVVNLTNKTN